MAQADALDREVAASDIEAETAEEPEPEPESDGDGLDGDGLDGETIAFLESFLEHLKASAGINAETIDDYVVLVNDLFETFDVAVEVSTMPSISEPWRARVRVQPTGFLWFDFADQDDKWAFTLQEGDGYMKTPYPVLGPPEGLALAIAHLVTISVLGLIDNEALADMRPKLMARLVEPMIELITHFATRDDAESTTHRAQGALESISRLRDAQQP
jgi:hypothetical protein